MLLEKIFSLLYQFEGKSLFQNLPTRGSPNLHPVGYDVSIGIFPVHGPCFKKPVG